MSNSMLMLFWRFFDKVVVIVRPPPMRILPTTSLQNAVEYFFKTQDNFVQSFWVRA